MSSLGLLMLLTTAAGAVASGNPYLEQGRRLLTALEFGEARTQLERARRFSTGDRAEMLEILELTGRCLVAEGKADQARATFTELLELAPGHELPATSSPKILESFSAAKRSLFPPGFVSLRPKPSAVQGIAVEVIDPWHRVTVLTLQTRSPSEADYRASTPKREQDEVTLAFDGPPASTVLWYLEARGADGASLARLGTPDAPKVAVVRAREPSAAPATAPAATAAADAAQASAEVPPWKRWARWGAAGLAVAGGVTAGLLQLSSAGAARDARTADWSDEARERQEAARARALGATGAGIAAGVAATGAILLWAW